MCVVANCAATCHAGAAEPADILPQRVGRFSVNLRAMIAGGSDVLRCSHVINIKDRPGLIHSPQQKTVVCST